MEKSLFEKLQGTYKWSLGKDNPTNIPIVKGFRIGFYNEQNEVVQDSAKYHFPHAEFTIYKRMQDFIWWDFQRI